MTKIQTEQVLSLMMPTTETMTAVLNAVSKAGMEEEPLLPQGQVGGCMTCDHTAASHFHVEDGRVVFHGCVNGAAETVYILVPAHGIATPKRVDRAVADDSGVGMNMVAEVPTLPAASNGHHHYPETVGRGARRYRYFSTLHHKAKVSKREDLSDTRKKVLEAVHEASKEGLQARDILKKTKLPHGSVQQTLNWLRAHKLVTAQEEVGDEAS